MSLETSRTDGAARPGGPTVGESPAVRMEDPGQALRRALHAGSRRIHLDLGPDGLRIRTRHRGELRDEIFLPGGLGEALIHMLEETAESGIGTLELDGGSEVFRYRLAACRGPAGRSMVLTLLPSVAREPSRDLDDLGLPEDLRTSLMMDLGRRGGVLLCAGPPGSGRRRTLEALVGELDPARSRVLLVAYDANPPVTVGPLPVVALDLRHDLWTLMDTVAGMDPDVVLLPEAASPLHITLAMALTNACRLVIAPVRAQDAAGALVKVRELASDRFRLARDLFGVLAQHRLPRPCRRCGVLVPIGEEDIPAEAMDDATRRRILNRAMKVRRRGKGCAECRGSGYDGWTYLFEYLSSDEDLAGQIREVTDPGLFREKIKESMAANSLLASAWDAALRGELEPDELSHIPTPEVAPLRLRPSLLDLREVAAPVERQEGTRDSGNGASGPQETAAPEPGAGGEEDGEEHLCPLYRAGLPVLRRAHAALLAGEPVDTAALESLASDVVQAVEADDWMVHRALCHDSCTSIPSHAMNTAVFAVEIARGLDWDDEALRRTALVALLHDVGLTKVPPQILEKKRRFAEEETRLVRQHPEIGAEMVERAFPHHPWLARAVAQVHERENGRGYPRGLAGDALDEKAKVVGLADVIESLTHERPWRPRMTAFDAVQTIMREHAGDFDRRILRAAVHRISLFPIGSLVRLNNGSVARVVSINPDNFYRPRVVLVRDASGKPVKPGDPLDLADSPFLYITAPLLEDPASARTAEVKP